MSDAHLCGHASRQESTGRCVMRRNSRLQAHRRRGRRQCRHAVLQPAQSARALQRARHAEVPAHASSSPQGTASTRTWAASSARSSPTRSAGTTPCAATPPRPSSRARWGESELSDRTATTGSRTATTASWSKPRSTASAGAILPPTSTGSARSWSAMTARCRSTRAPPRPAPASSLRFEMDTLVLFHTCPHPLNPAASYPRKPVRYEIFEGTAGDGRRCQPSLGAREHARLREQPHLHMRLLLREARLMIKESHLERRCRASIAEIVPAGRYWMHIVRKGETLPHRRSRRQSGRRHAVLQRRRSARALFGDRYHSRAGQHLSHAPARCCCRISAGRC